MVIGAAREERRKWRRVKSERKRQKAANNQAPKTTDRDETLQKEQADRLLLSALNYWEVKRDLIEERLAARRSATAAS
jgi:hypothetical protein